MRGSIYCGWCEAVKCTDFLPKSSTRRKSRFLFVIETARVLTLIGETRWPAKAGRGRRGKISRGFVGEEVIGREGGLIPKSAKVKICPGSVRQRNSLKAMRPAPYALGLPSRIMNS
jgi:hypothetical protein